jgi:hypothetical protein
VYAAGPDRRAFPKRVKPNGTPRICLFLPVYAYVPNPQDCVVVGSAPTPAVASEATATEAATETTPPTPALTPPIAMANPNSGTPFTWSCPHACLTRRTVL